MQSKIIDKNKVSIIGKINTPLTFSHQIFGERLYRTEILIKRLSDYEDKIPVMVPEQLVDAIQDHQGKFIEIHGQFRSYNLKEGKRSRLLLAVFPQEFTFVEGDKATPTNRVALDGYICKPPVYRKTPMGREITDLLIAVNRPSGSSDYIPCICWGKNACYASAFSVGDHTLLQGRIQSREYIKKTGEDETEKRTAYEVSVNKLELSGLRSDF